MAEESYSERTEQATPRRREEAKKKGQVAKSREIPSVLVLMGGASVLFFAGAFIYQRLSILMIQWFGKVGDFSLEPANVQVLSVDLCWSFFLTLAPFLAVVSVLAIAGHWVQTGMLLSTEVIKLDWSKISISKGWQRTFSKQSVMELLKTLFKMLIIGGVAWSTIKKEGPQILLITSQGPGQLVHLVCTIAWSLLLKTIAVLLLLAGLDYLFQRWTHEKSLRMSKQEMKEESRMTEGDPLIKARIRSIQRQMARRRMMAEVPKADVIITNPTHLAVALHYESKEMEAPRVVAKGAGEIAERIKEVGRTHNIPIVENKTLAQILYKTVDLGQTIPSALYQAVADILAHVYRIKHRTL